LTSSVCRAPVSAGRILLPIRVSWPGSTDESEIVVVF